MNSMSRWSKYLGTLCLCLLMCGLYTHFFVNMGHVEVGLEVAQKTDFKIYWAKEGQPFSEKNMAVVTATPARDHYSFSLTNMKGVTRLRIDTHKYKGEATLKSFSLEQVGFAPTTLSSEQDFRRLIPLHQIEDFQVRDTGLWLMSSGDDPNFELLIRPEFTGVDVGSLLVRFGFISFFVILVCWAAGHLVRDLLFVPLFLAGVWGLIIVMAGISEYNVHPDEYVHMHAASYYHDNWLPPVIEDESIRHTYSVYGISRLNNGEVYYLFAGKFDKLLESFRMPEHFSLRMFNIVLFGLILLYTIKNKYARMMAIPFLLSSQVWYLFSYCGSDAFALFVTFLCGCELVNPKSILNKALNGGRFRLFVGALLVGFLLGGLFLLKKNYYPFIAFFYLILVVQFYLNGSSAEERTIALKRIAIVSLAGLCFFGLRVSSDYLVNGFDRNAKISQLQEELAVPWYKASTELEKKHITMFRKARGTTLKEMVTVERWFEKSFRTGFGVFGYFTISATEMFYDLVRWTGVGLFLFVFGSIFLRGGLINSGLALSVLGLSAALVVVSLNHSWTVDFQAQGRYLFPILPMLGILYAKTEEKIYQPVLALGVTAMYLLGVYVFIFEGLLRIPKIVL